jgi:outer membrane immunogenic protein
MKRHILAGIAALGLIASSPAFAHGTDWTGLEVGLQGGYGWGTSNDTTGLYSFTPDGVLGGGHVGYNWQIRRFVFGIEGDVEGADLSGGVTHSIAPTFHVHSSMDFDASIRGRLGLAFSRFLVYGTGGAAYGDVNTSYQVPSGTPFGGTDGVRTGWTAGAGLDYALDPNWSVGAEYRYTDLGHSTFTRLAVTDRNEFNYNAIRLRITYRFAPPPPPPPPAPMPAAAPAPMPPPPARNFIVFFGFDKANLTSDARRTLEAAAYTYKKTGIAEVQVSGYTDAAGTQAYNLRLSHRRAEAVANYLAGLGVPRHVMDVKWFGKEHLRVPTPNGVREPQNRRVEIMMP